MHEHSHHHDPATAQHPAFDTPEVAAFAELEGEVLLGFVVQAASTLAKLCHRHSVEVRRVLDIGCGPGVASCCLAQRFGAASVLAVDGSAAMLERAAARAERSGLGQRVETRLVELPTGLETLGRANVAWASMVIHHVGDEAAALRQIRRLLEPDGLLAVLEWADPMRVLPEEADLGRPGIWERLDAAWAAWFADMRASLPGATISAGYPEMLEQAGFELLEDELLTLALGPPLDDPARRFAHQHLVRAREVLAPYADAADVDALHVLIDEDSDRSITRRDDVELRASRHLYVGRPVASVS